MANPRKTRGNRSDSIRRTTISKGRPRKSARRPCVLLGPKRHPSKRLSRLLPGYTLRGSTANFDVYYQDGLGTAGHLGADAVLGRCEQDFAQLQAWFGGIGAGRFSVYIDAGMFGGYHAGCDDTELHLGTYSNFPDVQNFVNVAEVDEVFMANQGAGWDCGKSNGEGLSRFLATQLHRSAWSSFPSAAFWLNSERSDWVTNNSTDTDLVAIGCSELFLNFLHYQLGIDVASIVQGGKDTLAKTYINIRDLWDGIDAFGPFVAFIQRYFPAGKILPVGAASANNLFPLPGWHGWSEVPGGGTTDVGPACITDPSLPRLFLFGKGVKDPRIYQNVMQGYGSWSGWSEVPGDGTTDRELNASVFGKVLHLFAKGIKDPRIYENLRYAAGNWSGWNEVSGGGTTDRGLASAVGPDGKLHLFAKGIDDRRIYQNAMDGGANWSGWNEVPGGGTTDMELNASMHGGSLHLFAKGINDKQIYENVLDLGGQWSGWAVVLGGGSTDVTVASQGGPFGDPYGDLFLFAKGIKDGKFYVNHSNP